MKKRILLLFFILYVAFSGIERYVHLKQIAKLQYELSQKQLPSYVEGVKTGLEFKKNQQEK